MEGKALSNGMQEAKTDRNLLDNVYLIFVV